MGEAFAGLGSWVKRHGDYRNEIAGAGDADCRPPLWTVYVLIGYSGIVAIAVRRHVVLGSHDWAVILITSAMFKAKKQIENGV